MTLLSRAYVSPYNVRIPLKLCLHLVPFLGDLHHHHHRRFCVHLQRWPADITTLVGSGKNSSEQKRFQMSSEGCRCGLATNVIWKAVPCSRTCMCEGPLAELGKCTWHDIVSNGSWSKTAASSCSRNSLYSEIGGRGRSRSLKVYDVRLSIGRPL